MSACRIFLVIITCLSVWTCASGHHPPFPSNQPVMRNPEFIADRLRTAVDSSATLSLTTIGQVRYDTFEVPVRLVRLTDNTIEAPLKC